jgi:hypothetical protein
MKKTIALFVGAAFGVCATATLAAENPKGWFPAGSHPKDYQMSADREMVHAGKASASIKSTAATPGGFGTLMQTCSAEAFRGKRVRMSGHVRAQDVSDWTGLWMRVDGPRSEALAFDNMQDRAIKGTSDWTKYEIVLDVSEQAQDIAFGLLLSGRGRAWMDDLKFEVVGTEVPTTGSKLAKKAPTAPANLDFEE